MNLGSKTIVILDNVRSAFNVGAIFRTGDACNIETLYLIGITPKPPLDKLNKTSVGAVQFVNWKYFEHINECIDYIKKLDESLNEHTQLIAVEQSSNSKTYFNVPFDKKVGYIFGHEITGINQKTLDIVDLIVQIPMLGKKNSLNVATTVGIVLYERIRQQST